MPIPEPLPDPVSSNVASQQYAPNPASRIRTIDDVNVLVHSVIWRLSEELSYTGIGRVQNELFRLYPSVYPYLKSTRCSPDMIPAIVEHKQLIQRVNTQLWAYATTRNVVTLADLENLLIADLPNQYHLLGSITCLPAALEICHTPQFHPRIIAAFTHSRQSSPRLCASNEDLLRELNECVCLNRYRRPTVSNRKADGNWWESIFTHHMLLYLNDPTVPQRLDRNTSHDYNLSALSPYGIRINGFNALVQSINDNLRPENLTKAAQAAQEWISTDVRNIFKDFQSQLLSDATWNAIQKHKPARALNRLADCASNLHRALTEWAESRDLRWPPGHLDSLLLFGDFVLKVSSSGSFRSILHLLLYVSMRPNPNVRDLLKSICNAALNDKEVVDLTGLSDSPDHTTAGADDSVILLDAENTCQPLGGSELTDVVEMLHVLLEETMKKQKTSDVSHSYEDYNFWRKLAELERNLPSNSKTTKEDSLLNVLAKAAEEGELSDLPDLLQPYIQSAKTGLNSDGETEETDERQDDKQTKITPDFGQMDADSIVQFVRRLTELHSRSVEDICTLVELQLKIGSTDELKQLVNSVLAEYSGQIVHTAEPVVYHGSLGDLAVRSIETNVPTPQWSVDTTSALFVQRERVVAFLAQCPSFHDLTEWSQWYQPNMLYERWGDLESFLLECGSQMVCNQYNLIAVRLLGIGGNLLRVTPCFPISELEQFLLDLEDQPTGSNIQVVCDRLCGTALGLTNRSVSECCTCLSTHLSKLDDGHKWLVFVKNILIHCPTPFLGVLFNKIIVPSIEMSGLRNASSWSADVTDSQTDLINQLHRLLDPFDQFSKARFVSAVGCLGLQMKWSSFMRYFEQNRLGRLVGAVSHLTPPNKESMFDESNPVPPSVSDEIICPSTLHEQEPSVTPVVEPESGPIDRKEFITELRRREFGCGTELDSGAMDLIKRLEGKLSRSLVQLSEDLYGSAGHFLLELIQNADDAEYGSTVVPSLEFCAVQHPVGGAEPAAALLVLNNESIGFTEADMNALCDVGMSTKSANRSLKTGRKGIGFKSVFNITDAPEVHSNGFHVRFHRQSRESSTIADTETPVLLMPEWCDTSLSTSPRWPLPIQVPSWCQTLFVLPIRSKSNANALSFDSVVYLTRTTLSPDIVLFLRRLSCVTFSHVSVSTDATKSTRNKLLCLQRSNVDLPKSSRGQCTAQLCSIASVERHDFNDNSVQSNTHIWFRFSELLQTSTLIHSKTIPRHTELSLAISLTQNEPLPECQVFAYLPVRDYGFRFHINADFDLTSSREDVDSTSVWNQWLVAQIPSVFAHMIQYILQLPANAMTILLSKVNMSKIALLGRILGSLPYSQVGKPVSHSIYKSGHGGLFLGLPAQLRHRLAQLGWLPVIPENVLPSKETGSSETIDYLTIDGLLVTPHEVEPESNLYVTRSSSTLINLLMKRLGKKKPHPEILLTTSETQFSEDGDSNSGIENWHQRSIVYRGRMTALLWLGVQTISVDALLNLASTLTKDELLRPGLLGLLLHNLEACIVTNRADQNSMLVSSLRSAVLQRRQILSALHHLAIFPMTNGELTRCTGTITHRWLNVDHELPILLPPTSSQWNESGVNHMPYVEYIQLVGKLGPLIDPVIIEVNTSPGNAHLPSLLTSEPPYGLAIPIATPQAVVSRWISPLLEKSCCLSRTTSEPDSCSMQWLVNLGQFYVRLLHLLDTTAQLHIPHQLPILTMDHQNRAHVLPPLQSTTTHKRDVTLILPPSSITLQGSVAVETNSLDEMEAKLFQFFLSSLDETESDQMFMVSAAYFEDPALRSVILAQRWFKLFSEAGACTLLSVHPYRYVISSQALANQTVGTSTDKGLIPLPIDHRLREELLQTLANESLQRDSLAQLRLEWVVEDYVSPGLDLLLKWISRLSVGQRSVAVQAAYRLACLLHDNWPGFDKVQWVWCFNKASQPTDVASLPLSGQNASGARSLGLANWLLQLRTTLWLPIMNPKSESTSTSLMVPVGEEAHPIYSPSAFETLHTQRDDLVRLLMEACFIWAPGPYIVRQPPNQAFCDALGLKGDLQLPIFESLMQQLSSSSELPACLTPELIVELYKLVMSIHSTHWLRQSVDLPANWLTQLFSNPDRQSILVRCGRYSSVTWVTDRQGKRSRYCERATNSNSIQNALGTEDLNCSVCDGLTQPGEKRHSGVTDLDRSSETVAYHLVKPYQVCWNQARLSTKVEPIIHPSDDSEDMEDDQEIFNDQYLRLTSYSPSPRNRSEDFNQIPQSTEEPRMFSIENVYGPESRSFFVDYLGIAATSSLTEVLCLRPDPSVEVLENASQWSEFGRRLGQWYALIDYCISVDPLGWHLRTAHSMEESYDQQTNSRVKALQRYLWRYPLLFGADGNWYKPCEVTTMASENKFDKSQLRKPGKSPICLFTWSKPTFAHLAASSPESRCLVLAHSLSLLDISHHPESCENPPSISHLIVPPHLPKANPTSPIACTNGTAHGLLLDLLEIPVLDKLARVSVHEANLRRKAVQCAPVGKFFDAFLRIVSLWTSNPANVAKSSYEQVRSRSAYADRAYLMEQLHVILEFHAPLNAVDASIINAVRFKCPVLAYVLDGTLYLDSTLGAEHFGRLSMIPPDYSAPMTYLCVGLLDDPGLDVSGTVQLERSLFAALVDYIYPYGGRERMDFVQFMQGLLNLLPSLVPELRSEFSSPISYPNAVTRQLQNYLTSHGVRKYALKRVLHVLCETPKPIPTYQPQIPPVIAESTVPGTLPCRKDSSSVNIAAPVLETLPSRKDKSSASTAATVRETSPLRTDSSSDGHRQTANPIQPIPEKVDRGSSEVQSASTQPDLVHTHVAESGRSSRSETIFGNFPVRVPFRRLQADNRSTTLALRELWDNALKSSNPNLSSRLQCMLSQSHEIRQPTNATVGRLGELYVYDQLNTLVDQSQEPNGNFDQLSSLQFPTGNPLLGSGRLVKCHWCNEDRESGRPYDLQVDVEVECDSTKWDHIMESLSDDIARNVVRVLHYPSHRNKTGLLSVGPIFIEVKSTAGGPSQITPTGGEISSTDLFELSVSELLCASQQNWRYHLIRLIWQRDSTGTNLPDLTAPPRIYHVPHVCEELRTSGGLLKLCLAMLRSD